MGQPMLRDQALETIAADTLRIQRAAEAHQQELVEMRVQEAANNLARLFGIRTIFDIEDNGEMDETLLSLRAEVQSRVESDPRLLEYVRGVRSRPA